MFLRNSGFAPRRRQGGFIQGAILFALVIIAVVVAAFSLANRDSQTSADTEQARVNASFVLKVGNDLQTAVNRAIADGLAPAELIGKLKFDDTTSDEENVNLFDPALQYMTRQEFPDTALTVAATQPFDVAGGGAATTIAWETATAVPNVGQAAVEDAIIKIGNIAHSVCQRINVSANGALVTAEVPGTLAAATGTNEWREGCYGSTPTTEGFYFRVVATDVGA